MTPRELTFATWSLRNPKPAILLFAVLCLFGLWGLSVLHVQYVPDIQLPKVRIELSQNGAAPAQLEAEVARKVEDAVAGLQGVKHIETSIADGHVLVEAKFEIGKNHSEALVEVKDAIDRIRNDLPADMDPPQVSAPFAFDDPVLTIAVADPRMDESDLSWWIDDTVGKTLSRLPSVGRVERIGGVARAVRIDVDPARMAAMNVTPGDLSVAVKGMRLQASGGRVQIGGGEQRVRVLATAAQASELESASVVLSDGRHVRLDQFANVHDGHSDRTQQAVLDGLGVVGFRVYRGLGQDELQLTNDVRASLDRLAQARPGLVFTTVADTSTYTRKQYVGSLSMLYEGAILAVLVVWCFLRDWRATLVSASALPLSILPAFGAMAWLGFSLNTLTLLALAAAVGILVDDAIVEIENIVRHVREGRTVREATGDAVNEIGLAVIATTLTLAAVFVPTSMMHSVPGLFFKEFGWTAALSVLASLLVARVLTPAMAATWLKAPQASTEMPSRLMERYLRAVEWCLRHRVIAVGVGLVVFVMSVALVPFIPTGLLPTSDSDSISATLELDSGTSLADTTDAMGVASAGVARVAGVTHVLAVAGDGGAALGGDTHHASLTIALTSNGQRADKATIEARVRDVLTQVPGVRSAVGSGKEDERLEMTLVGDDDAALTRSAHAIEHELRGIPGLSNISTSADLERPEVVIRPDLARASELGVSTEAIAQAVRIATSGDFDARLPKLDLDSRQVPILIRVPDAKRRDFQALGEFPVAARQGTVPLNSMAELSFSSGPSEIDRLDRRRNISITASLGAVSLGDAEQSAFALSSATHLPPGISLDSAGNAEDMHQLLSGFGLAMGCSLVGIYCVLVLLFKDFIQPFTILSALPLSLGGAFIGLLLAHAQLNIPSLIGMVMLMGVVTKNSILLVEYALVGMQARGLAAHEAILDACRKRARPIIMTSIAMIAGLAPIVFGLGADSSFRRPMAAAVIGGLATSTALSLLLVPVFFSLMEASRPERRVKRCAPTLQPTTARDTAQ